MTRNTILTSSITCLQVDILGLEQAIEDAALLCYKTDQVLVAKNVLASAKDVISELRAVIHMGETGSNDRLERALSAAKIMNGKSPEWQQMISEATLVLDLRAALARGEWGEVKFITDQAARENILNAEIDRARETQLKTEAVRKACDEINAALKQGGVVDWHHEYIETQTLQLAVDQADDLDWSTAEAAALLEQAKAVLLLR